MSYFKQRAIRSKKLRDSARGQKCTLQLPCCRNDTETVVLAHLPDESHGMGRKSDDLCAVYACHECHDAIDGRTRWPLTTQALEDWRDWYFRRAQMRTLRRWAEIGLIRVEGAK